MKHYLPQVEECEDVADEGGHHEDPADAELLQVLDEPLHVLRDLGGEDDELLAAEQRGPDLGHRVHEGEGRLEDAGLVLGVWPQPPLPVEPVQSRAVDVLHRFHNRLYNHGEGPYYSLLLVESAY